MSCAVNVFRKEIAWAGLGPVFSLFLVWLRLGGVRLGRSWLWAIPRRRRSTGDLDTNKSWCWHHNLASHEEEAIDSLSLHRRRHTVDLGRYGKTTANHPLQVRMADGISRLGRLAPLPLEKLHKVVAIKANGFQTAFFGAENVLLGQGRFAKVRQAVVACLLRRHRRACPFAVCSLFGDGELDPLIWVLLRLIRQCRKVYGKDRASWNQFRLLLGRPFTPTTPVYGPAGVLQRYLQVVDLRIDSEGWITEAPANRVQLLDSCVVDVTLLIRSAWDRIVHAKLTRRSGAEQLPPINSELTRQVLDQVADPSHRQASVVHMAGGFPTRIHLAHSDGGKDTCTCGERDTLSYRVLRCPYFAEVRQRFPVVGFALGSFGTGIRRFP